MPPHHPKTLPQESSSSDGDTDVAKVLNAADLQPDPIPDESIKLEIVWWNVYVQVVLHGLAFYGFYLGAFYSSWGLVVFSWALTQLGGLGITAGAHRLWSHKSYSAKTPLRVFLMLCNTLAGEDDLYKWCRDHRVHHKWSETNADPYNANRGMFFSHMGWLMCKKHPDVMKYGNKLDCSDLLKDPVVAFQRNHYMPMFWGMGAVMPTLLGSYLFGDSLFTALCVAGFARYAFTLHSTWLVNSLAHYYGLRPYDAGINPAENMFVSFAAIGEGFHNYHHCFPYDYSTSEMGWSFNFTTIFIDLMYVLGQAYDLRIAKKELVNTRKLRTGDPTNTPKLYTPTYGRNKKSNATPSTSTPPSDTT